jgi:hypothetical protein
MHTFLYGPGIKKVSEYGPEAWKSTAAGMEDLAGAEKPAT